MPKNKQSTKGVGDNNNAVSTPRNKRMRLKPFIPPPLSHDTSPVSEDPEAATTMTAQNIITPPQNPPEIQKVPRGNPPKQPRLDGNMSISIFNEDTIDVRNLKKRQRANKKSMRKKVDVVIALVEDLLQDMKLDMKLDEEIDGLISNGEESPDNGVVLGEDFTIDTATSSSSTSPADTNDIVEVDENGDIVEIIK